VHTSFLQKLRPTSRTFRPLFPLYPAAVEAFDLSQYDLVVSSSSAWAHAVICDEDTTHVCYCHNPFRYAWNDREATLAARNLATRSVLRVLFRRWRQWDWIAAQRVDSYLTNSRATQRRVKAYFGRDSTVLYPPVETSRFRTGRVKDYYLVVSELMAHKRIDVAVQAFNSLGLPLVVVGDGPEQRQLKRVAGPTVSFTGRISDEDVAELMSGCRALVVPSTEEFGIAAVEAQAAGRPVLAARSGGALETVREGITGAFWDGTPAGLVEAVRSFDTEDVVPEACVASARRFDLERFKETLPRVVDEARGGGTVRPLPERELLRSTKLALRAGGRG
jgi:glycosyltransferase involved in cell wall biosynthesis